MEIRNSKEPSRKKILYAEPVLLRRLDSARQTAQSMEQMRLSLSVDSAVQLLFGSALALPIFVSLAIE